MGRRKDDPLLQAAKGYPGKRKSKVEKEMDNRIDAEVDAVEASATADDPFPLPAIFLGAPVYWKAAIKLWKEQSEILRASGRRRPGYRPALTRYCIWTQLFNAASEQLRRDLPKGGLTMKVIKGDGAPVTRAHPNVDFMARAETVLRLLDAEFGFTPQRDADLIRVESFNAGQGKFNFQNTGAPAPQSTAATDDPMDLMNSTDSVPPDARLN